MSLEKDTELLKTVALIVMAAGGRVEIAWELMETVDWEKISITAYDDIKQMLRIIEVKENNGVS